MQTLYTVTTVDADTAPQTAGIAAAQKILAQHFDQTRALFIYITWFLTEVIRYVETDAHQKASKHLPTSQDLNVNTKIAGNEVLWNMLEDPALKENFATQKPELTTDKERLRRI